MKFKSKKQRQAVMASLNENKSNTYKFQDRMKKIKNSKVETKAQSKEEALRKAVGNKDSEIEENKDGTFTIDGEDYLVYDNYDITQFTR